MAREKPVLTRPSLQSDGHAVPGYARVAARDCAQGTAGACGDILASNRDCVRATRVVRALDCPGSQGRFDVLAAARAAGVRTDTLMPRNSIAWEPGGAAGTPGRMLHIAYSP